MLAAAGIEQMLRPRAVQAPGQLPGIRPGFVGLPVILSVFAPILLATINHNNINQFRGTWQTEMGRLGALQRWT